MLLGEKEEFCAFCQNHHNIFVKPLDGLRGFDISAYTLNNQSEVSNLYESLKQYKGKLIVEEKIIQSRLMSQWNPSSVNTVRIPSLLYKNQFEVIGPFLRMGRKDSIIDNAAQGGVFVVVDSRTGIILTDGIDEKGNAFLKHPDSGLPLKGEMVQGWTELMDLVEKIHRSMPSGHRYIGWDFAQTENGWVLVEGNWGQMLPQIATKKGLKDVFMKYMK